MSEYAKELAKDVLHWYNINFIESESSITVFFFDKEKMDIEPALFSSWKDVLCEMLFTMEESNKDTFEEIGEHVWPDKEILYVRKLRIIRFLFRLVHRYSDRTRRVIHKEVKE